MNILASIQDYLQKKVSISSERPVVEAYDIWSASYDEQPGNLMLDLDSQIFSSLITGICIENKQIADIGCGTGRHWKLLYERFPATITGYDVSPGMLSRLRQKFPAGISHQVTDNLLMDVPASSADLIITTLTVAHIENINEALASWARILKDGGNLVITDFHPATLAKGGKRSFTQDGKTYSVKNYVHPLNEIIATLMHHRFHLIKKEERFVDESVKSYYEDQHALPVYNKFKGMPIIYGIHLTK
ncbi:MAG: class I SAM-dependent methyltransferase [Ferruginibacter sp.]